MFSSVDTIWTLFAAALVFLMQAGFAMVETGFTRAKNAGNIIMKNVMDFCIGVPAFWFLGFGLMHAGSGPLIGGLDLFIRGDYAVEGSIPSAAFVIFQTVFCATSATIVSGAMAERTKFSAYCIYSFLISLLIYPISGHWIWGGGWLASLGFHDFAGSCAVHMVGGTAALVGAAFLGPRIGKYDEEGKPKAIPGHSLTLGALGVFILWFCWFGFNGGSTVSMTGEAMETASNVYVTTNLAACTATCATMFFTWIRYKKPDVSMTLNGSLAGLVAITAGCDMVSPVGAAIIGIVAGILVVLSVEFFDKVVKVDDPVGAVSVHGVCGLTGTLLTGLFSTTQGVLYGHGFRFFLVQLLGVVTVLVWVLVTITIIFFVIKKTIGLRVTAEDEIVGLDVSEHGLVSSYADFMPFSQNLKTLAVETAKTDDIDAAVPVVEMPEAKPSSKKAKMTKVVIILRQSRFQELKHALSEIGVNGITVTHVMGCGMQRGKSEYYRGVPVEMTLLPKLKVETIVSKVPVEKVIDVTKKTLFTGRYGDGKIFVYDVENVVKVRTGEEGYDALQDEDEEAK